MAGRLLSLLRQEGLGGVLSRVRRRVIDFPEYVVFEKDITSAGADDAGAVTGAGADANLAFGWLTADGLAELHHDLLDFDDGSIAEARGWLARGDRCVVARRAGEIVHYHWIATGVREHPGVVLALAPDVVVSYKEFTVPAERGRGLNRAAHAFSAAACRRDGATRMLRESEATNTASLRAAEKDGYEEIGRFFHVRVGSRRRAVFSRALRARYGP